MSEVLPFLQKWCGESTDELLADEGRYRIDSIVVTFEAALSAKRERGEALTSEEEATVTVEIVEREVHSGGFDSFFRHYAQYVANAPSAFERIGCEECAAVVRRAIAALGVVGPLTAAAIEEALDDDAPERDDALDEGDAAFYALAGPIADRLFAFVKANREHIRLT